MTHVHEFDESHALGLVGERIVIAALRDLQDWVVEDRASSMREQKGLGIDYVARFKGERSTIEIKTDMRSYRTENLAFEIRHDYDSGGSKEGWMSTTTAAFLVTLSAARRGVEEFSKGSEMTRTAMMFAFRMSELRRDFAAWQHQFNAKSASNQGYVTRSVMVPLRDARESPALVGDYAVAYRNKAGCEMVRACIRPGDGLPFTINKMS